MTADNDPLAAALRDGCEPRPRLIDRPQDWPPDRVDQVFLLRALVSLIEAKPDLQGNPDAEQKEGQAFLFAVQRGEIKTLMRTSSGPWPLSPDGWPDCVDVSEGTARLGNLTGSVFVDRASLERYLRGEAPSPAEEYGATVVAVDELPAAPNRGGRPLKYDWEGAAFELLAIYRDHGTSKEQHEVTHMLEEWFVRSCGTHPDPKEIRKRVKRFIETIGGET